jgi:hypothetical protein
VQFVEHFQMVHIQLLQVVEVVVVLLDGLVVVVDDFFSTKRYL